MARLKVTMEDGRELEGDEIDFEVIREPWAEYEIEGNVKIKIRTVATKIIRVVDDEGNPAFTKDGDPWIVVRNVRQMTVTRQA